MSAPIVHAQPSSQRGRVRLVSKGAPFEHGKLNVEWARSSTEPDVNGAAHFVNDKEKLHLYRSAGGMWSIAPDVDAGIAFAIARTTALHPNTIKAGEWQLPGRTDWSSSQSFKVCLEGHNAEDSPYDVKVDLGEDFFLRVRTTKVLWFRDPASGDVVHSGAKAAGASQKLGKRYCPLCEQCFSANNFVSQHVKNVHTPPPPTCLTCYPDGKGGVQVTWHADGAPEAARPVSFAVQYSTDGGDKWSSAIEDTHSAEPSAHITVGLSSGLSYLFRVGAIGIATSGRYSDPSLPFNPDAAARLMQHPSALAPETPSSATLPSAAALHAPLPALLATQTAPLPGVLSASAPPSTLPAPPGGDVPPEEAAIHPETFIHHQQSQPASPPPTPPSSWAVPAPIAMAERHVGEKRGHSDVGSGRPASEDTLSAVDLLWSLDDLSHEASAAETEGDRAFERLFGSGTAKKTRHASSSEEFLEYLFSSLGGAAEYNLGSSSHPASEPPVYRSLSELASQNPREASLARLERRSQGLSAAYHTYRSTVAASRDAIAYTKPPELVPTAADGGAAPRAPPGGVLRSSSSSSSGVGGGSTRATPEAAAGAQPAAQKLERLRHALVAAPARAKHLLLTPALLGGLSKSPHHRRELSLLLTHASHAAVEAAAAESIICEHASASFHLGRPPPPSTPPSVRLLRPHRHRHVPSSGLQAIRAMLAGFAVLMGGLAVGSAAFPEASRAVGGTLSLTVHNLLTRPPPPSPACSWSWREGCVLLNDATSGCRLQPWAPTRLCVPR